MYLLHQLILAFLAGMGKRKYSGEKSECGQYKLYKKPDKVSHAICYLLSAV
jgi:hypothetical protein